MRALFLLLPLFLTALLPAHAGHKEVIQIYLRVHVQTAGEGLPASQATAISLPPNGETIQIRTMPEFTERELIDVKQDSQGIRLILNHQGAINLNAVTAQNIGRILVVMINGVIVYAPIIDQQVTSGELDIPRQISPDAVALLKQTAQNNVIKAAKK